MRIRSLDRLTVSLRTSILSGVAMLAMVLSGCVSDDVRVLERQTGIVAADGLSLSLAGLALTVPPGAARGGTTITAEALEGKELSGFAPCSRVYRFGPDGLAFAKPVAVEIKLDGCPQSPVLIWCDHDGAGCSSVSGSISGGRLTAEVSHFSIGAAGRPIPPPRPLDSGMAVPVDSGTSPGGDLGSPPPRYDLRLPPPRPLDSGVSVPVDSGTSPGEDLGSPPPRADMSVPVDSGGTSDAGVCASGGSVATLHVDDSAAAGGNGSPSWPFKTIRQAFEAVVQDDTVIKVAQGTYSQEGGSQAYPAPCANIRLEGGYLPHLRVWGRDGDPMTAPSYIDSPGGSSRVSMSFLNTQGLVLDGFIFLQKPDPDPSDNSIEVASLFITNGTAIEVKNNVFDYNVQLVVFNGFGSPPTLGTVLIENNTFIRGELLVSGAATGAKPHITIKDNILYGPLDNKGIYGIRAVMGSRLDLTVSYNLVHNYQDPYISAYGTPRLGEDQSVGSDPKFVRAPTRNDLGDLHLASSSPWKTADSDGGYVGAVPPIP